MTPGMSKILLMEEILHHLGCINLVNNGITYLSTGAGFLPSTVLMIIWVLPQHSFTVDFVKVHRDPFIK